jgi:hypothetical protein
LARAWQQAGVSPPAGLQRAVPPSHPWRGPVFEAVTGRTRGSQRPFTMRSPCELHRVSRKTIAWTEISLSEKVDPSRRVTLEQIRERMEDGLGVEFQFETKSHGKGVSLSRLGADKRARRCRAKTQET